MTARTIAQRADRAKPPKPDATGYLAAHDGVQFAGTLRLDRDGTYSAFTPDGKLICEGRTLREAARSMPPADPAMLPFTVTNVTSPGMQKKSPQVPREQTHGAKFVMSTPCQIDEPRSMRKAALTHR